MTHPHCKKSAFLLTWIASTAVFFLVYGLFLRTHYSLDTYTTYFTANAAWQHLRQSRYLTAAISTTLAHLGIHPTRWMIPFTGLLILTMGWCQARMTFVLGRVSQVGGRPVPFPLCWLGAALTFINVLMEEWYLYPEYTLYYAVALITAVEGVLLLHGNSGWYRIPGAALMLLASLMTYQATLALFVIWHMALTLLGHGFRCTKASLRQMLLGIVIAFLSSVVILLLQKLLDAGGDRDAVLTVDAVLGNLRSLWAAQPALWQNQRGLWPDGVLPVLCGVLGFVWVLSLRYTGSLKNAIMLLAVLALGLIMPFAPHFVTQEIWLAQRTIIGFWALLSAAGVLLLALCCHSRLLRAAVAATLTVMLLVNGVYIHLIGQEHFLVNDLDRDFMLTIQGRIEAYEAASGIEVTKIAPTRDASFTYAYEGTRFTTHDTNKRCVCVAWGDVPALNHFTNRHYQRVAMDPDVYQAHFAGKDWQKLIPDEQLVFIGDTLYICYH